MSELGLTPPAPSQEGFGLMQQAQAQYPILQGLGLQYKYNPGGGQGFLEFWPGDEPGTPTSPRPKEFKPGQLGLEVFDPKTRPIDILGDVVSHHLINTDPIVKDYYEQFKSSMTPEQQYRLRDQYQYAQKYEQERRPFAQWKERSGLPGYFRGYAFQQWENAEELYTPDQIKLFDAMTTYLKQKPTTLK